LHQKGWKLKPNEITFDKGTGQCIEHSFLLAGEWVDTRCAAYPRSDFIEDGLSGASDRLAPI